MRTYLTLLRLPGAWKFSAAGFVARYPMAMMALSVALLIPVIYNNYTLAGQIAAANIVAFSLGAPVLARLVDRYGQWRVLSKSIAAFGISLGVLTALIWSHADGWVLVVASIPVGAFSGALGAMVRSRWAHMISEPGTLTQAFAFEAALDEVAYATGPMFATLLVTAVHPLAGLIACALIQVVGGYALIVQRATEPPAQPASATGDVAGVLRSKAILILGATYACAGAIFGALDLAAVAFATEQGARSMAGVLVGVAALGSLLGALAYGARPWPLSQGRLFVIGIVALALGNLAVLLVESMMGFAVVMFVMGLTIAPTMTNVNAMIQRIVHPSQLTEGLTWLSTFLNLGVAAGAAVGGRGIDLMGARGGFWVVAASAILTVLFGVGGAPWLRTSLRRADRRREQWRSGTPSQGWGSDGE